MPRFEVLPPSNGQPARSADYNQDNDLIAYPPKTPMMRVSVNKQRRITLAQTAQGFDPDYRQKGNCLGTDPNLFLPQKGEPTDPAKKICGECRVRSDCLEEGLALGNKAEGIWGGTSKRERTAIRAARQQLAQEMANS